MVVLVILSGLSTASAAAEGFCKAGILSVPHWAKRDRFAAPKAGSGKAREGQPKGEGPEASKAKFFLPIGQQEVVNQEAIWVIHRVTSITAYSRWCVV